MIQRDRKYYKGILCNILEADVLFLVDTAFHKVFESHLEQHFSTIGTSPVSGTKKDYSGTKNILESSWL